MENGYPQADSVSSHINHHQRTTAMSLSLHPEPRGDYRNARFLALASDLAYEPEVDAQPKYRELLGLDARLIGVNNTQAYVATSSEAIVVAFRGTENPATLDGLKDWLVTNALNLLVLPQGRLGTDFAAAGVGARFHQGFLNALADIWEPVLALVEVEFNQRERPIWVTGHSLGGALATLAGWLFTRKMLPVQAIYTFGAPMVGNKQAMEGFDRDIGSITFRYVDIDDPIPRLPTMSLIANAYTHCKQEKQLGSTASGVSESLSMFGQVPGQTADGMIKGKVVDDLWKEVNRRVNCHMMASYRSKLPEA